MATSREPFSDDEEYVVIGLDGIVQQEAVQLLSSEATSGGVNPATTELGRVHIVGPTPPPILHAPVTVQKEMDIGTVIRDRVLSLFSMFGCRVVSDNVDDDLATTIWVHHHPTRRPPTQDERDFIDMTDPTPGVDLSRLLRR